MRKEKYNPRDNPAFRKLPPQNIEAEETVLASILVDDSLYSTARVYVTSDSFYKTAHKIIFAGIERLVKAGEPIDLVSVTNELKKYSELEKIGGAAYLARLVDTVPYRQNMKHWAEIIHTKFVFRRVIDEANKLSNIGFDDNIALDELIGRVFRFDQKIRNYAAKGVSAQGFDFPADDLFGKSIAFESHIEGLNEEIIGFVPGELTVVGGNSGMGKSGFVQGLMNKVTVDENITTFYCAAQMDPKRIMLRMLAQRCEINFRKLWARRKFDQKTTKSLLSHHKILNKCDAIKNIIIPNKISLPELQLQVTAELKELSVEQGLLVIENLQQLTWPGERFKSDFHQASFMIDPLKAWAYELGEQYGITTIVSSQLNRNVDDREDKRPMASDLFSKSAEEISDNVVLLYRPSVRGLKEQKNGAKKNNSIEHDAELILAKGLNPVIIPMTFIGECMKWTDRMAA